MKYLTNMNVMMRQKAAGWLARGGKSLMGYWRTWNMITKASLLQRAFNTLLLTSSLAYGAGPSISNQPDSATVKTFANATFSVSASGLLNSYQWYRDGLAISGARSSTLNLVDVVPAQAGEYSVAVTGLSGTTKSAAATLAVLSPFLSQPQGANLVQGQTLSLSAMVDADAPKFQWLKNGSPISEATASTLIVSNVQPAHAGTYSLKVYSASGAAVYSDEATVQVLGIVQQTTTLTSALGQTVTSLVPVVDNTLNLVGGLLGRLTETVNTVVGLVPQLLATLGSTVTLSVEAVGPGLHYVWTLNGNILPGETGPTLTLSNIQAADGGAYGVTVYTDWGILTGSEVHVVVDTAVLPFAKTFSTRGTINGAAGVGRGDVGAGREKYTSWLTWVAPASGVVVMTTLGSTFDTTLSVSTGGSELQQTAVGSDDDSGGYLASQVMFNAQAGVSYNIAIDSYNKKDLGNFQLSWNQLATQFPVPANISNPSSVTVNRGGTAQFAATYQSVSPVTLQWYRNGQPLAGQNQPILTVFNVQETELGQYSLEFTTPDLVFSTVAADLQINTEGLSVKAVNKQAYSALSGIVGDLLGTSAAGTSRVNARSAAKPEGKPAVTKLGGAATFSGYTGTQIFKSSPGKDPGEPNYCNVVGGSSFWLSYRPGQSGQLNLSTEGSSYDTLLAVYTDDGSGRGYDSLNFVAWDNNSGADGRTSKLSFNATAGTTYYIVVDGVQGAYGTVYLNYNLNVLPTIATINEVAINQSQSTAPITFTIGDFETPATSLTVEGTCMDSTLVSSGGISLSGSGTNRTVTITPNASAFGTNWVKLTVRDSAGGTKEASFQLKVAKVNRAPVASPTTVTRLPNSKINISLSAILKNCSDADQDTLTITTVSAKSVNGGTLMKGSSFITYTPVSGNNATDRFTVTISDGNGGTATATVYIYVNSSTGTATAY